MGGGGGGGPGETKPGLSRLQAACWRAPAGCGRKAGLRGVVLALKASWSLGGAESGGGSALSAP